MSPSSGPAFSGPKPRHGTISAGRRLKDKGIEIGKREIETVPLVEAAPRYVDAGQDELEAEA